jgi:hypothetical protein
MKMVELLLLRAPPDPSPADDAVVGLSHMKELLTWQLLLVWQGLAPEQYPAHIHTQLSTVTAG